MSAICFIPSHMPSYVFAEQHYTLISLTLPLETYPIWLSSSPSWSMDFCPESTLACKLSISSPAIMSSCTYFLFLSMASFIRWESLPSLLFKLYSSSTKSILFIINKIGTVYKAGSFAILWSSVFDLVIAFPFGSFCAAWASITKRIASILSK